MKRKKYVKHIVKEGSRNHVILYFDYYIDGKIVGVSRCSEPDCEENRYFDELVGMGLIKNNG